MISAAVLAACSDDNTNPSPTTYSVGGTLSGLTAGKSVVLRNNGGDDKTLDADGPFTFATRLASGGNYNVTVLTQPAGMVCPVTGGVGSIAASDVTTVAVDCSDVTTTLDHTFGPGGTGFATFDAGSNTDDSGNELTLDGSGRLVVAGHSFNPATGALEMALWRVDTNGTIDGGFGTGGLVRSPGSTVGGLYTPEVIGSSVRVDGSGRIVVAGYDIDSTGTWGVTVWRFTSAGQPDATFGTGGFVRLENPQSAGVGLALDGSGRPVVSGFAWNGTDWDAAVWRFTTDGIPDSTFNGTGFVTQNSSAGSGQTMGEDIGVGVAIDGSGRIVMAGYSSNAAGNQDMTVWRYTSAGVLDASFNGTGFFRHDNAGGGGGNDVGRTIAFDGSNRIVVVGWSPSSGGGDDLAVWRLTPTGALDMTFNGTGYATHNGAAGGNGTDTGRDIAIDAAGRLILVGESTNAAGDLDLTVWRYTASGLLDVTFNGTGYFTHSAAAGGTNGNDAG
ncbi:MAG TPA: hypothetical protein VJN95_00465, partial [Gemmatimonadales bacterium]|nr:hypothetical protein [Gemmatimonadales bacterium]